MSEKIIIENMIEKATWAVSLEMILKVIEGGRVSNNGKQYCYGTKFDTHEGKFMVSTDLNNKSDRFIISDI